MKSENYSTQHPDNARPPYWKNDGNRFVSSSEETAECVDAFRVPRR